MTCGATFFNFGGSCAVRLVVALASLREHYHGPVTVFFASGDDWNRQLEPVVAPLATVQWFDMERITRRQLKCVLKPQLFRMSPYDHTLMFDGDLLFQAPIDPLFEELQEKGFLVTQFSTWHTDGPKMRARLEKFRDVLPPAKFADVINKRPALNIGVMGWSKGNAVIDPWEALTIKFAGRHMADEHAAQVAYADGPHVVMPPTWNESCLYRTGKPADAKILHFHGNKHCGYARDSSHRWIAAFRTYVFDGTLPMRLLTWGDPSLTGLLKQHPELLNPNVEFKI